MLYRFVQMYFALNILIDLASIMFEKVQFLIFSIQFLKVILFDFFISVSKGMLVHFLTRFYWEDLLSQQSVHLIYNPSIFEFSPTNWNPSKNPFLWNKFDKTCLNGFLDCHFIITLNVSCTKNFGTPKIETRKKMPNENSSA